MKIKILFLLLLIFLISSDLYAGPVVTGVGGGGTDDRIGTITDTKWCIGSGTQIVCTEAAPAGAGDITDVWSVTSGNVNALTAAAGDSLDATAADSSIPWKADVAASLPGTCTEGMSYWATDTNFLYICTATNTWTRLDANLSVDDLITLSGVSLGAVNLGTFTGTTIADNQTIKQGLQALETALELKAPIADPTFTGTVTGTFSGNITGGLTGNASTATALAANPTDCGANTFATTIAASGNLTCSSVGAAALTAEDFGDFTVAAGVATRVLMSFLCLLIIGSLGLKGGDAWAGEKEELALTIENCQLKMQMMQDQFKNLGELLKKSQERYKAILAQEEQSKKESEKNKNKISEKK